MRVQLRDYQADDFQRLRQTFADGYRAPIYRLPTGGGKTVVFCAITEGAAARNNRVMILVHRKELLAQSSNALTNLGVAHGLVAPADTVRSVRAKQAERMGESLVDQLAPVQVASIDTLNRRLDKTPPPDLLIVDEGHHLTGTTKWAKPLQAWPNTRVLGVTATPHRLDGKGLGVDAGGWYDVLVEGPDIQDLVEWGYLCPSEVYAPPVQADLSGVRTKGGDYQTSEVAERVDKPQIIGDAVDHYARICPGTPAIAFCASRTHAEHTADQFRQAGFRAAAVDGETDARQRDRLIDDLGRGQLDVLTSCEIISEGTDVPIVGAAILLRPTQSLGMYLQQVGRVLRPYPGKDKAIILDHVGNCLTHGLPDEPREWSLAGAPKKSSKGGADNGPPVRQCPECFAAHHPAPKCPQCGYQYAAEDRAPEQVDGELQQVDPQEIKRQRRREEANAESYEDLLAIEKARGYKPGWAWHRYQARKRKKQGRAANVG